MFMISSSENCVGIILVSKMFPRNFIIILKLMIIHVFMFFPKNDSEIKTINYFALNE